MISTLQMSTLNYLRHEIRFFLDMKKRKAWNLFFACCWHDNRCNSSNLSTYLTRMKLCDLGNITLFIQVIEQHKDPNRTIHEATNNAQQRSIFAVRFTRVLTVVHNFMARTKLKILVCISTIFFLKSPYFSKIRINAFKASHFKW